MLILQILAAIAPILVSWWLVKYLPSYVAEKGKNLATKEDLEPLTKIAEAIKSKYAHSTAVQKIQFETEFAAYKSLWSKAHKAAIKHIKWLPAGQNPAAPNAEGLVAFAESQVEFTNELIEFEPFIPKDIWASFFDLDERLVDAKSVFQLHHHSMVHYYIGINRKAISDAQEKCREEIRLRLASVIVE